MLLRHVISGSAALGIINPALLPDGIAVPLLCLRPVTHAGIAVKEHEAAFPIDFRKGIFLQPLPFPEAHAFGAHIHNRYYCPVLRLHHAGIDDKRRMPVIKILRRMMGLQRDYPLKLSKALSAVQASSHSEAKPAPVRPFVSHIRGSDDHLSLRCPGADQGRDPASLQISQLLLPSRQLRDFQPAAVRTHEQRFIFTFARFSHLCSPFPFPPVCHGSGRIAMAGLHSVFTFIKIYITVY